MLARERGDPQGPADDQVFLTHNAHWSPKGLELNAHLLAENLESRPWFERSADSEGEHASVRTEQRVACEPEDEPLPEGAVAHLITLAPILTPAGEPIEFTDRESPIVILGDSYCTIYREYGADFPRHLAHLIGEPVDVVAAPGGGRKGSCESFTRRRGELQGKRLAIWAFTSHALLSPTWWRPRERADSRGQ